MLNTQANRLKRQSVCDIFSLNHSKQRNIGEMNMPKKELNDEKIKSVEEQGFFTGRTGDFWIKPIRASKTLTDREHEKFDRIRVRILELLQGESIADYMSKGFDLFPYAPEENILYAEPDEKKNKKHWMTLIRNRLCRELARACDRDIFIFFQYAYGQICQLSAQECFSGNVRKFIDKLQQCDLKLIDAKRQLQYILEYASEAPAQVSVADLLNFVGRYTQYTGEVYSFMSQISSILISMQNADQQQQLENQLAEYTEKYPELTQLVFDLRKRNHELEFNVKITVSQQRAAELIQEAALCCNYTCYKKCSRRTIINWEKKHNSKPDWYDKKLRVLGEAILADEVLQGMRRELMARDNLKRGYTRGNHSKE